MASVGIRGVRKAFGRTKSLHGVDAEIADGGFRVSIGTSGCGKSTLLRLVAGLGAIGGDIAIGGRVVDAVPPRQSDIAMVFQNDALYPHMTVRDTMASSSKFARARRTRGRHWHRRAGSARAFVRHNDRRANRWRERRPRGVGIMQGLTRRATLGVGAGLAAGLVGGARAGVSIADAPPLALDVEKGASLRVLRPSKFVDPDQAIFNANSQAFAERHSVTVRVDYAAWEDLRPQTAVTANTGAGPDVVVGWTDDPHLYAERVLDLTDVAQYLGTKYGGWYPLAERYGRKVGTDRWIAIPMGGAGSPAVYRESWVREAGYDRIPTDTDKFLDLCRKLKANGHPAGFTTGHAVGDANAYCHWLVLAFGGAMVDENQRVTINSKATVEALKYGRALYETFIAGTQSWLDPSNNKALIAGEIGMTQNGVSLYFSIKNSPDPTIAALAADINHARMPIGPVGHSTEVALAINAMAFKHSKYPNAAKAYLAFMMEAPQYDHWLTDSFGYWSQPLKAYAGSEVWVNDPKIAAYKDTMQDSTWLGYKGAISEASGATVADYVMVDMVAAVNSGDSTPEDAAREAERRAKRYYKA